MPKNAILSDSRLGLQEPMTEGSLQATAPRKSPLRADGSPHSRVFEHDSVEELPLKFEGWEHDEDAVTAPPTSSQDNGATVEVRFVSRYRLRSAA